MTDFAEHLARSARLVILRALAEETSRTANEVVLRAVLESFGINRTREYVRTQLNGLRDLGAVQLRQAGSVTIAVLTQAGLDHVEHRAVIDGVDRPSPGA